MRHGMVAQYILDTESCLDALEMTLKSGYVPRMIDSDQGCQFTSHDWTYSLSLRGIKIIMDGKGRCLDNIPIERFINTTTTKKKVKRIQNKKELSS
jgi:putative transposase